jgi:molybdate transport system substrate-binding protein
MADFHGDLNNPALVLYVGGNYYFAMRRGVRNTGGASST